MAKSSILLDITAASPEATDAALEAMHRAMADPADGDIWQPLDDPILRDLVEHWTLAGLKRLQGMREDFLRLVKRVTACWQRPARRRRARRWIGCCAAGRPTSSRR